MQAPASVRGTQALEEAVVKPFQGFRWRPKDTPRPPVGRDAAEARGVAWLLSCAAYAPRNAGLADAGEALRYATHLQREAPVAARLYKRLVRSGHALVPIAEVEAELGCRWGQVDITIDGQARRLDPYFWKMVEALVRDSVSEYLARLDHSVQLLRGMDPLQHSASMNQIMDRVRRGVQHHLANALLQPGASQETVVALLLKAWSDLVPTQAKAMHEVLQSQIRGVRALSMLAAVRPERLDEKVQELDEPLAFLLSNTPEALEEQFTDRGLSLLELRTAFGVQSNGLLTTASAVPPPSVGVRAALLARWLEHHHEAVAQACVSALVPLKRALERPPDCASWASVELLAAHGSQGPEPRVAHAAVGATVLWHPPAHLGLMGATRAVVVPPHSGSGLRIARFLGVLLAQARAGLLPPGALSASVLLPVVSRFTAEGEVAYGQVVDMRLRPLGALCGLPWPEAEGSALAGGARRAVAVRPLKSPTPSSEGSAPGVVAVAAAVPGVLKGWVHPRLARDHAILDGLCRCLQHRVTESSLRVSLDDVIVQVRAHASSLSDQSDSSLRQCVRHVCELVVRRATDQNDRCDQRPLRMAYDSERDRSTNGKVGGVVCEGEGGVYLLQYAVWCVRQMRYNSAAFRDVWKETRSARSHAPCAQGAPGAQAKKTKR